MSARPWYKRYGADFVHGVVGMGPDVIGAYAVVLDLIYDHAGPIRNDARWLGGILGCSPRMATALIQKLIVGQKLFEIDGMLSNHRAEKELEYAATQSRKFSESGAKGGRARVENEGERHNNNYLGQASLKHRAHKLEAREEKTEEDTNVSLSEASSDQPAKRRKRANYPPDFEAFWTGYPTDALMSKKAAGQAWSRMTEDARGAAMSSLPSFRTYCSGKPDYRPVHAVRFLAQERFVGFNEVASKAAGKVFVAKGTPQWDAWQKLKRSPCVTSAEHRQDGWWFDSEWPSDAGPIPVFLERQIG